MLWRLSPKAHLESTQMSMIECFPLIVGMETECNGK